jgi:hypothetical protein
MYTKLKKAEGGSVAEEDEDMNATSEKLYHADRRF